MPNWVFVVTGGGMGALGRYLIGGWINRRWTQSAIPFGTLGVNILGCLIIGLLAGLLEGRHGDESPARHFLMVGLMGGFTTYSSFGLETLHLMRGDQMGHAMAHMGLHLVLGLVAVWLGFALSRSIRLA